ncbi:MULTISPECIES: MFS transporter [unclassified Rathayibacter]|uniref:MFS transporter n=1 Tax=unclassified Rathayibacter TaxID=2609250 RepID=UPI001042E18A|nr:MULTISPECIES: MFS transporter [unclassified Rathayibacter]TCL79454.1 sugar phosphate permease [Rathayibacter sp. PhB192]TCM25277.1 sugar phosphate permease [Rathayibacter sp. PhB179]
MSRTRTEEPPTSSSPRDLPRSLAWALGSGTVLQGLNSAIIAVALVPIALQFGSAESIPWLVSGLYIAAAVGAPAGGRLADLFGPRRVYLAGLVVVLAASVAGPFTPSIEWLVLDRIVLGLGTSIQFPAAMAIIRRQAAASDVIPVGAIGIVALCGQATAALGPTVGGLLVTATGWQGIFWVNLPIILNSAIWVLRTVPADAAQTRTGVLPTIRSLDPLGMVLFVGALVALMLGLLSLTGEPLWLAFAVGAPLAGALVWRELSARSPFVDLRLLGRHPQIGLTCLRAIATFTSFYCVFYGLPQWLESTRGLDPAVTGLLMLPVFGVGVLSTLIATRLGRRAGPRVLLAIGTTAMVAAGGILVFLVDDESPLLLLVAFAVLLGVPNGFNNLGNQLLLHAASPSTAAGSASGLYRTAQYIGACASAVVVAHALESTAADGGIALLGAWIAGLGGALLVLNLAAMLLGRRRPGR